MVMFDKVGSRLYSAIIRMNIPIDDLPWVDGRLDVVKLIKGYLKGR